MFDILIVERLAAALCNHHGFQDHLRGILLRGMDRDDRDRIYLAEGG